MFRLSLRSCDHKMKISKFMFRTLPFISLSLPPEFQSTKKLLSRWRICVSLLLMLSSLLRSEFWLLISDVGDDDEWLIISAPWFRPNVTKIMANVRNNVTFCLSPFNDNMSKQEEKNVLIMKLILKPAMVKAPNAAII